MIGDGGRVEEASRARVRCAWSKFMELAPILTLRGASLRLKGKIYKICVQRVLVYGSETWAAKADDIQRLQRTERAMVRWMCGVKLEDRRSNKQLLDRLQVVEIGTVVSRGRLGWYDHVERMPKEKWVSKCRELEVEGDKGRGRGKKTWRQCVGKTESDWGSTGGMCGTTLNRVVVFLGTVQPAHALKKNPVPTVRAK